MTGQDETKQGEPTPPAGHGPVDRLVGRPAPNRVDDLLAHIEQCRREVAKWPAWMKQTALAPAWMAGWDD